MIFRSKIFVLNVDIVMFVVISIMLTIFVEKLPERLFYHRKWLYNERKWEKGGGFYQHHFSVKKWKACLPEISEFLNGWFPKKSLNHNDTIYYEKFIAETCKAEFTHWMIIVSTVTFYFWDGFLSSVGITIMAFALNFPYIIIQRYNRPRLIRIMKKYECNDYQPSPIKVVQ